MQTKNPTPVLSGTKTTSRTPPRNGGARADRAPRMRGRVCAMGAAAALVLLISAGAAAQQGGDVVVLKNGGMLRGTVVALEPGVEVTILVMGTGTQRTLPWAEVDHVDRAPAQPATPPAAAAPPAGVQITIGGAPQARQAPSQPGPGAPRLHIESNGPFITLYRVAGLVAVPDSDDDGVTMEDVDRPVCVSPCDRVIDGRKGQSFKLSGPGVVESDKFQIANLSGDVEAHVDAGSNGARFGGFTLALVGLMGVSGGALVAGMSTAYHDPIFGNQAHVMEVGGLIGLGIGAALTVGGIVLWRTKGVTRVTLEQSSGSTGAWHGSPVRPQLGANGFQLVF